MKTCNLFLAAAPRSGSTQLAHWLASHPMISLSQVKEPNYFSHHEFDPDYVRISHLDDVDPTGPIQKPAQFAVFRNRARYDALFNTMSTPWRMEASTSYLACPEAPEKMYQAAPHARVIVLTRNPLDRALSHYQLACRTGRTTSSLAHEIADERNQPLAARYLLRPSRQDCGLARFQHTFGHNQVLHLTFEDMIADPKEALGKIGSWLEIDTALFDLSVQARNKGQAPRFARLNAWLLSSGFKTALRARLPSAIKNVLKPIWFSHGTTSVTDEERNLLQRVLCE